MHPIEALRRSLGGGLTQTEFARLIAGRGYERDVSQSLVSQIETGRLRCSADLALFLAQQFPTELGKLGLSALDLRRAAPAKRRRRR